MKTIDVIAAVLVVVGAANWGLVGLFQFDLVAAIFGEASILSRLVYCLVGAAGVFQAVQWKAIQRRWAGDALAFAT
ncbi:MAG TPA: DUF378 domain-containing protein [Gammaproteobacteria bacterium]|nr:DUF378 domain-containing protein [Gammaproteobacteria bacterium]